jgi:dynein heavy chain
LGKDSIT